MRALYEERSRNGLGDFRLTRAVEGYWDGGNVEIDLVALDDEARRIRFVSCKRNPERALADLPALEHHVGKFLERKPELRSFRHELVLVAPRFSAEHKARQRRPDVIVQDVADLCTDLSNRKV